MKKLQKVLDAIMKALTQQEAQWVIVYSHSNRCLVCHELSLEAHTNIKKLDEVIAGTRRTMPDWILMGVFESRMEASLCLNEMWQELDHAKRAEAVTEEIFV
jgi:hypothetical protein